MALSRGLGLPMPRAYRAPYMPGLTVLIPHYGEGILMKTNELFDKDKADVVPLMDWLKTKYGDEFGHFVSKMQARPEKWKVAGDQWLEYPKDQWTKINSWASMRMQTL